MISCGGSIISRRLLCKGRDFWGRGCKARGAFHECDDVSDAWEKSKAV